jgi:UDP-N-acetylglucosamine 1-carboxyvinyltransferase
MDKFAITGGTPLKGEIPTGGSKNSALPALAAALLTEEPVVLKRIPRVRDIRTIERLLVDIGSKVEAEGETVRLHTPHIVCSEAPYELVKTMRASSLVLGPLVARCGRARVSLPGGCAIGARPIDQHLKGLEALGARIELEHGLVSAKAKRLRGATIVFDMVTVTGTENLMMAAALAKGCTTLENAACEPEVEEMARVLNKMGARIRGAGTSLVTIEGVDELHPLDHAIIPDRVEAGTLMVAAAVTRGNVLVQDCLPEHLDAVIAKLRAAGVQVTIEGDAIRVVGRSEIRPADIATRPYPGFPTDMQAQFMVLMAQAHGQSVLSENIFENRFMHVPELRRMGADIVVEGHTAIVRGPTKLKGAKVMATDLRASACLVLAGLVAAGTTEVLRVYHLDRGYEHLEKKLRGLGADIRRVKGEL